jgi:uncharacterized pyridoxamine 5'-phosphate oxidase family protein
MKEANMNRHDILEIINSNPAFHLATVDDGHPRVRGMLLYRADEAGIVFHTGAMKDVHRQLLKKPEVELCFFDPKKMIQVRVQGVARQIEDPGFKQEIVDSPGREFLKPLVASQGMDILSVFCVEACQAVTWTMATNFEPKTPVCLTP